MSVPLTSLIILDFSTLLPSPYASIILAELGAEILRIESPKRLDLVRMLPPLVRDGSATHATLSRSKHSLSLNLKKTEAVKIIQYFIGKYREVAEEFASKKKWKQFPPPTREELIGSL